MGRDAEGLPLLRRLAVTIKGQGITEYALILGLVVFGIWVLVGSNDLGDKISDLFDQIAGEVEQVGNNNGGNGNNGGGNAGNSGGSGNNGGGNAGNSGGGNAGNS